MIAANDLRIGNCIKDSDGDIIRVGLIVLEEILDGSEEYSPILLTPQILEAAGFERSIMSNVYWAHYVFKNGWHISMWQSDKQVSGFEKKGLFYYGDNYNEVKYVHQLQNLYYSLTGNELNINLKQLNEKIRTN